MFVVVMILLFVLGAVFGSFWSVLIWRLQDGYSRKQIKGILYGRSQCPGCYRSLTVGQLVPFFGWIRQRGKCFRCGMRISSMYPVLELVSGAVFMLWWYYTQLDFSVLSLLLLSLRWLLSLLLVWDMYTYELHMPLFSIVATITIFAIVLYYDLWLLIFALWFLVVFVAIYYFGKWYSKLRFWVYQEAFGFGDVILAPVLWVWFAFTAYWDYDLVSLMRLILYFMLLACVIWILYYIFVKVLDSIVQKMDLPDLVQYRTSAPMIPFFPAMIVSYWILVVFVL